MNMKTSSRQTFVLRMISVAAGYVSFAGGPEFSGLGI